jgi:hypothetical protein
MTTTNFYIGGIMNFVKKIWWFWGVPFLIAFFSYSILVDQIKTEESVICLVSYFLIITFISYLLGVGFRQFVLDDFPVHCRKCGAPLGCFDCSGKQYLSSKSTVPPQPD